MCNFFQTLKWNAYSKNTSINKQAAAWHFVRQVNDRAFFCCYFQYEWATAKQMLIKASENWSIIALPEFSLERCV